MAARKSPSPVLKGFLSRLATAVANASEQRAMGEAIVALAPRLLALPDEAFAEACMSAILDSNDAATLHADVAFQRITRWWEANRPRRPGEIPREVEHSGLPADAKRWAGYWIGRLQEGASAAPLRLALSLVRSQSPEAFDWLVRNNTEAGIAARHGNMVTVAARQAQVARDWRDPAKVEQAIESCLGFHDDDRRSSIVAGLDHRGTLRALVARWAPENLHLLDRRLASVSGTPIPAAGEGQDMALAFRPPSPAGAPQAPAQIASQGIFGGPPPRQTGQALPAPALARAYSGLSSPAAQYRAEQLAAQVRNQEDHGQQPD